jgi:hypothetical protein
MGRHIGSVVLDDAATLAMGVAFDLACVSLRGFSRDNDVREAIAKRIVEAAANGERDPVRLHSKAFMGFCVDDVSQALILVRRIA